MRLNEVIQNFFVVPSVGQGLTVPIQELLILLVSQLSRIFELVFIIMFKTPPSKSLENEFKTFKLPKYHGNNFIQAGQSIVKNEAIYHSKDLIIEKVANECKHCGKHFSERSVLEIHERSHASNLDVIHDFQSFGCFYCDKKFANKIQVENHEKIHTGGKSVALDSPKSLASDFKTFKLTKNHGNQFILDFQSSVKNEGNDDTKEVTNEVVPLECKYCGKNFSDGIALKVHEKIHLNTKCPTTVSCLLKMFVLWKDAPVIASHLSSGLN